jgi:DNA-binding NarL/FixJ family response regulator
MILYFAADLIWGTRIKGTADALGLACRPARTPDMLRARLADSPVRALIVDLDSPETALELIRTTRSEASGGVRVVAFGPHMAKDALQAARDAGADEVLARGAFDAHLPDILLRLGSVGDGAASAGGA